MKLRILFDLVLVLVLVFVLVLVLILALVFVLVLHQIEIFLVSPLLVRGCIPLP